MKKKLLYVVLALSVLLNVFLGTKAKHERADEWADKVVVDTFVVRDTIRITKPTTIYEEVLRLDTAYLERADTIRDTVYVRIPITQRVYENERYKAVVQGYHPRLVSLDIYTDKTYVYSHKTIVKPAKMAVSVGVYGGLGPRGLDYGVGVMVGFPVYSWTW
ncbi:MAG: hypothetical protein IKJ09_00720 [Bacteroidaceae bacterium]|nr:hypothetical protein [Bacteroidaceae bacterium]